MNIEENSYLDLVSNILENGTNKDDRTGVGTKSIFGTRLEFSLKDKKFPLLTTKKMFTKGILEEALFFLRGDVDTKNLEQKGVNIWKGNTSREFLDKRGLTYLPEGSIGKSYSHQWRNFGGSLSKRDGVDQIDNVIRSIKFDPNARKHIVCAWNPMQSHEMALEPCHCLFQFYVENNNISCQWYQRSVDVFLGLPFNIASYAAITNIVASVTNTVPDKLIFVGGDTHIYNNHIEQCKEQIKRVPFGFPTLNIKKDLSSLNDIEKLCFDDFEVKDYICHPSIKAEMAV